MGYNLHITKSDDWIYRDQNPITLEEWKSVVESDVEMELIPVAEVISPEDINVIDVKSDGMALWNNPRKGFRWHFHYTNGEIIARSPHDEALLDAVIQKMKEIATKLDAKVLGDDGEEY